jgi:hypothetical protein
MALLVRATANHIVWELATVEMQRVQGLAVGHVTNNGNITLVWNSSYWSLGIDLLLATETK